MFNLCGFCVTIISSFAKDSKKHKVSLRIKLQYLEFICKSAYRFIDSKSGKLGLRGLNAFHIRLNAFFIKLNAFYIKLNAFYIRLNAFDIKLNAFYIRLNAFDIRLNAFDIRLNAFYIRLNAL